jgi:omega-amidase
MQDLNICFIQSSIQWEDKKANLDHYSSLMNQVTVDTDIILLPEMFNTGFSMEASRLAETMQGDSISWMKSNAIVKQMTIVGSLIIIEKDHYYNRLIVALSDGNVLTYDKRHLFRMAGEDKTFTPSEDYIIFNLKGWKIRPFVCYDLRFPVWGRNKFNDQWEYDLAIYIANWPASRTLPWKTLPIARAIENQCFVATLNRVGKDAKGLDYNGDSQLINSYGEVIMHLDEKEYVITRTISRAKLDKHRVDFPVGLDADPFIIPPS